MTTRTRQIKESFSQAENYDKYAIIQPMTAEIIAGILPSRLPLKNVRRILELGAGTGALTLKIAPLFPNAEYVCTDLSEKMLLRARQKTAALAQKISFFPLDMESIPSALPASPPLNEKFDLIISNLALQWVAHPEIVLEKIYGLLNEGGGAFLTTLLHNSLKEWRLACEETHTPCAMPDYPTAADLEGAYPKATWKSFEIEEKVSNALSFLKGLKEIGAAPRGIFSDSPKTILLKKAIKFFDERYKNVTYTIGLGELYK